MRIMAYNILKGGLGRVDPLAEVIRHAGADVVACVEADSESNFSLLAERLGMHAFWTRGHDKQADKHGAGVLSRFPIVHSAGHVEPPLQRGVAEVHVQLPDGGVLPLFALHLTPHIMLEREAIRMEEVQALLRQMHSLRQEGRPHVVLGDFNATHPGQKLDLATMRANDRKRLLAQGNIVPTRVIEAMLEAGYVDAYDRRHGSEDGLTFTTTEPSLRLDYIFLSPTLAGRLVDCDVHCERLAHYASDHYPVWADLDV